jgi:Domain of unknown function (DUF1788)
LTACEIIALERSRGYLAAQDQVTTYLSDRDWHPLSGLLAERLAKLDPSKSVVFLTRVAAMAPGIYHMSKLLDQMQGRTLVTTILFYPGSIEGTTGNAPVWVSRPAMPEISRTASPSYEPAAMVSVVGSVK